MVSRILISFFLVLIFHCADAQVNEPKGSEVSAEVKSVGRLTATDSKLTDLQTTDHAGGNQQYLDAGTVAEKKLQDRSLLSDRDLSEKDFIIERSSDIKIIYTPSGKKQEN